MLPKTIIITYERQIAYLDAIYDLDKDIVRGYDYQCPKCYKVMFINILESNGHKIYYRLGEVTIRPSIVCPMPHCTFHGLLSNNIMEDTKP